MNQETLTFWSEERPASHSASQDCVEDLAMTEATSRSPICEWLTDYVLNGAFGKTSPVSCHPTEDGTLVPSSGRWLNSGIAVHGECWTLKTSESHSDAEECFLSDVLQETGEILPRYYLSSRAAAGILKRAEKRGKKIPEALETALLSTSKGSDSTAQGE